MNYQEFNSKFKSQVTSLSFEKQLILALSICKKLFFDYQKFYGDNQWGNPDVLLDTIRAVQDFASGKADSDELKATLNKIDNITPDTADFAKASYSVNACGAVYEMVQFLFDKDSLHIHNIGTYLTDTVDSKVQEVNDLSEHEIDNHPLMVEAREYLILATTQE